MEATMASLFFGGCGGSVRKILRILHGQATNGGIPARLGQSHFARWIEIRTQRLVEILVSRFGEVLIPQAVLKDLRHPKTPDAIGRWLREPPEWLRVSPVLNLDKTIQLGKGVNEAISLAIERRVKMVLMDERLGRGAAEARGLISVGTLNMIDLADEHGLLDGIAALNDQRETTFRASPELLGRFEERTKTREALKIQLNDGRTLVREHT